MKVLVILCFLTSFTLQNPTTKRPGDLNRLLKDISFELNAIKEKLEEGDIKCQCLDKRQICNKADGSCVCPKELIPTVDGKCEEPANTICGCVSPWAKCVDGKCTCPLNMKVVPETGNCLCLPEFVLNEMGKCVCPKGFVENELGMCEEEKEDCVCSDSLKICVDRKCVCRKGTIKNKEGVCKCPVGKDVNVNKQEPVCVCPKGFMEGQDGKKCVCRKGFIESSDGKICLCPPRSVEIKGECVCERVLIKDENGDCTCPKTYEMAADGTCVCPRGMIEKNSECSCPTNNVWTSDVGCVCRANYVKTGPRGECSCPAGFREDAEMGKCEKAACMCLDPVQQCNAQNICICPRGMLFDRDIGVCMCPEDQVFLDNICQPILECQCVDPSQMCEEGRCVCPQGFIEDLVEGICVCPLGMEENEQGRCEPVCQCLDKRMECLDGVCLCPLGLQLDKETCSCQWGEVEKDEGKCRPACLPYEYMNKDKKCEANELFTSLKQLEKLKGSLKMIVNVYFKDLDLKYEKLADEMLKICNLQHSARRPYQFMRNMARTFSMTANDAYLMIGEYDKKSPQFHFEPREECARENRMFNKQFGGFYESQGCDGDPQCDCEESQTFFRYRCLPNKVYMMLNKLTIKIGEMNRDIAAYERMTNEKIVDMTEYNLVQKEDVIPTIIKAFEDEPLKVLAISDQLHATLKSLKHYMKILHQLAGEVQDEKHFREFLETIDQFEPRANKI